MEADKRPTQNHREVSSERLTATIPIQLVIKPDFVQCRLLPAPPDNHERQEEERTYRIAKEEESAYWSGINQRIDECQCRSGGEDYQTAGGPEVDQASGRT